MKKIITLCAVVLALAFIVTAFTACKNKPQEETTTTTQSESVKEGFSVVIDATKAVVKKDGKDYQTLKFPLNTGMKFDLDYATKNNAFIDMNFDGQPDFYIAVSAEAETIYYYCWLFNATTKKFEFSVSLSGLTNISVDANTHTIYSTFKYRDTTKVVSYKWVNGALVNADEYDNTSDTIPPQVTEAVSNNVIGNVPRPQQTTKPQQSGGNSSATQSGGNKPQGNTTPGTTSSGGANNGNTDPVGTTGAQNQPPLNTTTTAPRQSGIEVMTGDINNGWY